MAWKEENEGRDFEKHNILVLLEKEILQRN
jgi:hypothetical protein